MRTILILAALLLIGVCVPAHAADFSSRESAWSACVARANSLTAETQATNPNHPGIPYQCVLDFQTGGGATGQYCVANKDGVKLCSFNFRWTAQCPSGNVWNDMTKQCQAPCTSRPPVTSGFVPPNGSLRCEGGCEVVYAYNGDGTSTGSAVGTMCKNPPTCGAGYYWHGPLSACVPVEVEECEPGVTPKEGVCKPKEECPAGMHTDENGLCKPTQNECPAGQVKSPEGSCLPGEGQCAAGEVRRANGTCGKDADGDGEADDDDDDPSNDSDKSEFSGGDSCTTPPSCSGDAIMCGQARIQWRIECNTRRNVNITGGGCDAVPVCTGEKCNAMEYAQLLQQWRGSCAMQKLAGTVQNGGINVVGGGGGGPGAGDGNGNGIPDAAEGNVEEGTGPEPSVGEVDAGALWSKVDQAGWLGGGACPGLPTFQYMGRTFALSEAPCEQGAVFAQLTIIISLTMAGFIIGRAAAGG